MEKSNFIKSAVTGEAALGVASFVPEGFAGVFGQKAPGNKVKIGLNGCRNQGWANLKTYLQYPEVECVSLCDINP